jgi:hypothetical protein
MSSAALRLAWRCGMDCKRVDGSGEFLRENLVDHPMAVDAAAAFKTPGHYVDPEMRFALGPVPCVAGVKM